MLYVLIAIILLAVLGAFMLTRGAKNYSTTGGALSVCGFFLCFIAAISAVTFISFVPLWISAEYEAKIINREYGTHYTREDVFFARDVIDTIREIDRKRIEVNGDIMREEGAK